MDLLYPTMEAMISSYIGRRFAVMASEPLNPVKRFNLMLFKKMAN